MNRRTFVSCLLALPGLRWLKPKAEQKCRFTAVKTEPMGPVYFSAVDPAWSQPVIIIGHQDKLWLATDFDNPLVDYKPWDNYDSWYFPPRIVDG